MAIKEIPFEDATASQLAEFASVNYGLDVRHTMGHAKIVQSLQASGYDKQTIEVNVPDIAPAVASSGEVRRMAKVFIPEQEKPGGSEPVWSSVNGKALFTPRNRECEIPYEHYLALMNAVRHVYDTDENGGLIDPPRNVPEYPVSLLGIYPPLTNEAKAA